jgi:predicted HicB family RNase H-like nuclease
MSDTASWFYGERLPEIAREHDCSLKEAERIFMDNKVDDQENIKQIQKEVIVPMELSRDVIADLAVMAHEQDITLNQLINKALKLAIKEGEYKFEHEPLPQLLNEKKKRTPAE